MKMVNLKINIAYLFPFSVLVNVYHVIYVSNDVNNDSPNT